MNNQTTALVLFADLHRRRFSNEVAMIWYSIEYERCCYRETTQGPRCLGPSFYVDICGEHYCQAHAVWAMEGDAVHVEEELEAILEGVRRLAARGLPLPSATARLLSRLSLGSTAQLPIMHNELGAAE